jgi:membrane-associated HD superfamily phosphohydrolase
MNRYLAVCLLFTSFSANAALHKWVDADGVVHYSDTVPSSDLKAKTLRSSSPSSNGVTSSSGVVAPKTLAEREADEKKAQKAKSEADEKSAKEQELTDNKRKNCENARTNLLTLENAPRLITYDAQGERIPMEDDVRQKRIEEARKAISSNCN